MNIASLYDNFCDAELFRMTEQTEQDRDEIDNLLSGEYNPWRQENFSEAIGNMSDGDMQTLARLCRAGSDATRSEDRIRIYSDIGQFLVSHVDCYWLEMAEKEIIG